MEKHLINFNGGLQTKIAPHLADDTQSVACVNVDLDKGSIYPYREWVENELVTATGTKPFFYSDTLITNSDEADDRSYAIFGTRLYWTNADFTAYGLMRYDGTQSGTNAVAPTVTVYGALTLTPSGTNGAMNETYAYQYTVVDTDGIESVPSPIYTVTPANENVDITIGSDTVTETVASRRIYRSGGSNPTFNLIAELTAPTLTYVDTTRDLDVSRIELSTFDNYAPPPTLTNLIEASGTMWGSVGDRVYFSKEGQPEFWNPLDFIVLSDECTGLGVYRDLVVAFTESNTYLISGFNRDNVTLDRLPYNEGCLNHHTIANVTEMLMWTSKNGVCIFDGSTVEIITRNILSWTANTVVGSASFDSFDSTFDANIGNNVTYALGLRGRYYAVYQDGIGVVDLNNGVVASTISLDTTKGLYYDYADNSLNAIVEDFTTYTFDRDSTNMSAQWKTPELQDGEYAQLKQYRRVYLSDIVESIVVYVNGSEIITRTNTKEFFLPAGTIGNTIQFHITTNREIRTLRYEFGVTS